MKAPSQVDKLRAIERALVKCGDETAAVEAALEDTRAELARERSVQKGFRTALEDAVADGQRRKLILLSEARAGATSATVVIQRLVTTLEQLKGEGPTDPLYTPTRAAKGMWSTLLDIRERLSQLISEVPS